MDQGVSFLQKHWYGISICLILLIAAAFRFYGYDHRWGLAYDQAHDVIVAREAIRQHKLPQLGPFSSAGPFVTGPEWYWFIMFGTFFFPNSIMSPWIFLTICFVAAVYWMISAGKELNGKLLGIIAGLLTAFSPSQIAQSLNVTNQAPLSLFSIGAIWCMIKYFHSSKGYYLFFQALFVALGINTHLQGVLLIPLLLLTIFSKIPSFKTLCFTAAAFILPFLPLLLFDLGHHFYDSHNMLKYYFHDQYKISLDQLGRNWRTYLGIFWPRSISYIIGGYMFTGYITVIFIVIVFFYSLIAKFITKEMAVLFASLFVAAVFMRYTRTPLFDSYLMFLNPWILCITAWTIYYLFRKIKILGLALLVLLLFGSAFRVVSDVKSASNLTASRSVSWVNSLSKKFPDKKFAVYDYQYKTGGESVPLSLFLDANQLISDSGIRIGVAVATTEAQMKEQQKAFPQKLGYRLFILNSSSTSAELKKHQWILVNPMAIYHNTEEWYQ